MRLGHRHEWTELIFQGERNVSEVKVDARGIAMEPMFGFLTAITRKCFLERVEPLRVVHHRSSIEATSPTAQHTTMASFFDIRARQAAAVAAKAGSSKNDKPAEDNRLQPWVEK